MSIRGIHHITAMSGSAQENIDFYAGVLGLRFIKATINYDDPGTWHLYYGDGVGRPGSLITFFPWPGTIGRHGTGQLQTTSFAIPAGSLEWWKTQLANATEFERLGDRGISFQDPHGMKLELIESSLDLSRFEAWQGHPQEVAIRGFHAPTLVVPSLQKSVHFLEATMGFQVQTESDGRVRLMVGEGSPHQLVDLVEDRSGFGTTGAGTVHHIAWRVDDLASEVEWMNKLASVGARVTDVQDRSYFQSIYFREPGGVLFEIATEGPGWTIDEPLDGLGTTLALPPRLESYRDEIRNHLPKIQTPSEVVLP